MKKTKEAFRWIVKILRRHKAPFQITGGFAARIYGSKRPLADIDIDIPERDFHKIFSDVRKYVIWGPKRYLDRNWDLPLMTLKYKRQEIDICGARAKIRDAKTGKWRMRLTNFLRFERKKVYGTPVPVIKKIDLIKYKKLLGRRVDLKDVAALSG